MISNNYNNTMIDVDEEIVERHNLERLAPYAVSFTSSDINFIVSLGVPDRIIDFR
jgi:hypothetical protein